MSRFYSEVTAKGNSSYSDISQIEADMRARELDIKGCIDCTNCTNCIDCFNCADCINCENCINCMECIRCDNVMNDNKESDLR